jgi:hypothetical protein
MLAKMVLFPMATFANSELSNRNGSQCAAIALSNTRGRGCSKTIGVFTHLFAAVTRTRSADHGPVSLHALDDTKIALGQQSAALNNFNFQLEIVAGGLSAQPVPSCSGIDAANSSDFMRTEIEFALEQKRLLHDLDPRKRHMWLGSYSRSDLVNATTFPLCNQVSGKVFKEF